VNFDLLNRVARAAATVERLEPSLKNARIELHDALREAHANGADVATLARVSGLSRQRVNVLLARK
jgi:hypothetical protein